MEQFPRPDQEVAGPSVNKPNDWDNLAQIPMAERPAPEEDAVEKLNFARQQNKTIAALYNYQNTGELDPSILGRESVDLPADAKGRVYNMLHNGEFTPEAERKLVGSIFAPDTATTMERFADRDKHELRILGAMTEGERGFANYQSMGKDNLEDFLRKYPLPMDFEKPGTDFVEMIGRANGEEKAAEYATALESLMHKIYGKQYEYYKILQGMKAEADHILGEQES